MKQTKRFLFGLLLMCVLFCVLTLVGCDTLLGSEQSHEHKLVAHEGQLPTCTETGWSAYYTCEVCEFTTYNELVALGHKYGEEHSPNGDVHSRFCDRCNSTLDAPHNWKFEKKVSDGSCVTAGTELYKCNECGLVKTVSKDPSGHTFSGEYRITSDSHIISCEKCVAVVSAPHEWEIKNTVSSTCVNGGYIKYSCKVCAAEKTDKTAALGHDLADEFVEDGDIHAKSCSRCSYAITSSHNWDGGTVTKEPSCAETGTMTFVCTDCRAKKTEEIPVTVSHSWDNGTVTKEPICNEDGVKVFSCTICGEEKTEAVSATNEHSAGDWQTAENPTATVDGLKVLKCVICGMTLDEEIILCDAKSMPVLYFEGDYLSATNAKNEVQMAVTYTNPNGETFTAYATIKVQGSSSTAYAKKNYTVKLYKDDTYDKKLKYDFGWGKESKYVIKANWVDFSQSRNVVSCRLWGDIVASRAESDNQNRLAALKTNGGAIDGFPISVYMNGQFHGIYTLNVPKDEWMFGMEDSETEALIAADNWNATDFYSCIEGFKELSNGDIVSYNEGWELRYCGTDDYSWVAESFDRLIRFCQENEGEAFRAGIANYLDVDAAIDYIIFMYANGMRDNASKNMLWATYDGKTWIPSVYDQDGTFGQVWDGVRFETPSRYLPQVVNGKIDVNINYGPSGNNNPKFLLWDRVWNAYTDEIIERYNELRQTTLSVENMIAELKKFEDAIPQSVYEADADRWAESRAKWWAGKSNVAPAATWDYTKYHFDYMYEWVEQRMARYDAAMASIAEFAKTK